jgi:hypothetical protein
MQKFATPTAITTVLDIPAGRIQLIAADRTDTTVEIRPANPDKNRDTKAAQQIQTHYDDGTLHITAPEPQNQYFGPTGAVEITVQLPTGSTARINGSAVELRTVGRLGDLTATGLHHHTKIDEAATTHLTATDGDIAIGRLTGPATLTTARGDITITEAHTGALTLTTQMGDISLTATTGASAALSAKTGHGRITNALKNDGTTTLDITATTHHGDITALSR